MRTNHARNCLIRITPCAVLVLASLTVASWFGYRVHLDVCERAMCRRLDAIGVEYYYADRPYGLLSVKLDEGMSDRELREVLGLVGNRLQSLILDGVPITDEGLALLAGQEHLEILLCSGTAITDRGVTQLRSLPSLKGVDLTNTAICGPGLATLEEAARLERLVLAQTHVDDDGLAYVARLRQLRRLNLSETAITKAGLRRLSSLNQLAELRFGDAQFTEAEITEAQSWLPRNCVIWLGPIPVRQP